MAVAWLSKHQTLAAALFFILILHLCFFPFIWGNENLLAGSRGVPSVMPAGAYYGGSDGPTIYRGNDMGAASWMLEADAPLIAHQYLNEKRLPLWNPYQAFGTPLAADMQSQPYNPLYVLYSLHPGPRTFNLFILCRFFIAGFCTYLYLRLFLPFAPCLAGGLVSMLAGYNILFYNMPHLSVEVLLPPLFLATEWLLRRQSVRNVLFAVAVVFLIIAGGMPESTLLALTFGYAYLLFRLITDPDLRAAIPRHLGYAVFVNAVGFALAAILLFPFIEFLRVSFDRHQVKNIGLLTGLSHDRFGRSIFTYVVPMLFGTAWSPIAPTLGGYASLRNFFGFLPFLMAAAALTARTHRRLVLFFAGSALILLLKRYGVPPVNWIGYLPFFSVTDFKKYEEPLLSFAMAALCAFGVHQVLTRKIGRRYPTVAFLLLAVIIAVSLPAVLAANAQLKPYLLSLTGAAAVLLAATVLILRKNSRPEWVAAGLLALLACEMSGDYIYPVYYRMSHSATNAANPYRGAPFIEFLKTHTAASERTFARDRILHPNWAGTFQLADIRGLDAMYYWKYLRFVRFFLRDEIPHERNGELIERFTGGNEHLFDTVLKRRLLQLASVKYLMTSRPVVVAPSIAREINEQNIGRLTAGLENHIALTQYTIGGDTKFVLYEHPPYDRLPFAVAVTPAQQRLLFSLAMNPAVYDGSQPLCGDGVDFRLEARDKAGRTSPLYERYIDPKHNPADRRWVEDSADLSRYLGQQIDLLFTTTPGPAGNNCMDWAGWGNPHFSGDAAAPPLFQQVYDRELKIYEYADPLPRAALYSAIETATDDQSALTRLGSPSFDPFQTAVVTATDAAALRGLTVRERVRSARILSYTSQEVQIDADTNHPSLLVLNDSDYPGWKAYVDGRQARVYPANYMFRGVLLTPGKHMVRFAYEPASFVTGAVLSGIGLLCLAAFVLWSLRRSRIAEPHLVH